MAEASPDLSLAERIDAVCDQFERDFRAGQQPRLEQFLAAADERLRPALFRTLLELELELRQKAGQQPLIAEYETRFLEQLEQIRQAFEAASRPASMVSSVKLTGVDTSKGPVPAKSTAESEAKSAPKTLGRFEILSVLGEGAFGTVYRARDPQLDREVAVKVPKFAGQQSLEDRERFLREARAAANLHHPQICPVHEVGTIDGRDYIVLAYIDGKPLSKILQAKPQLSDRQIVSVVRKLALALQEAHDKGIIHRDLKPANIMINRKGEPVIMDFGLARRENSGDAQISHSGQIMGTPAYMSPEQARGDGKAVGPASDIYSLGIVLYELLCGRRPFEGTVTEVIGLILHVDAPPPSEFRPTVDPRLQAICLKAIAKQPGNRYASMKDFATALADYVKAAPATTRPADAAKAEPESADELHTTQFAQLLAAMSSDVESKVERAVRRAGHSSKIPWWTYLVGSGFMGLVVFLGIVFFIKRGDTTVIVQISIEKYVDDLKDPALSFLLDNKPIEAAALESPIELKPGEHELIVNRDGKLFKRFAFNVEIGRSKNEPVVVQDVTPGTPELPPAAGVADGWIDLFNGNDLTGWRSQDGNAANWKVGSGYIEVLPLVGQMSSQTLAHRSIVTERLFPLDFELHAEFWLPREPEKKDQARGNSGIYLLGRHEIQICDSYENPIADPKQACGAVYNEIPVAQKANLPPETWQAFDIRFQSPRADGAGKVGTPGRVTVVLNGKTVIDNAAITSSGSRGAVDANVGRTGPILLQAHGSPVRFRNLRLRPLTIEQPVEQAGWIELFNGKDLSGWKRIGPDTWSVRDNAVFTSGTERAQLVCDQHFDNFELTGEVYTQPKGNGGICFRVRDVINGQIPRTGYEYQIAGSQGVTGGNYTGSLYAEGAIRFAERRAADRVWSRVRIRAEGGHIQGWLDDRSTFDFQESTSQVPKAGRILALESHARGDEVGYRNLRIRRLTAERSGQPQIPLDAKAFNGHSYKFFPEQLSWKDANARCEALGGHLVIVETPAENAFVAQLISAGGKVDSWIGATDECCEGKWRWVDGRDMTWTNWFTRQKQPNNKGGVEHFGVMSNKTLAVDGLIGWEWTDQPNESLPAHQPGYVCEWDSIPADTISKVDDPDRKAAESLLSLGGGFVKVNGQDRQIRQVSGLPMEPFRLTGAYFAEVKALDDNGLAVLKDCVHLTELDLRSTRVTEKGLEIFRGKTNFTSLGLAYLRVTDRGLEVFKDNKGLKSLFLHDTFLTDKGLSLFHDCKELGTIWVGGTPITDAGVLPFRDCRFLKWLDVRATKVTRDGVRTMKSALPACRVDVDPDKR